MLLLLIATVAACFVGVFGWYYIIVSMVKGDSTEDNVTVITDKREIQEWYDCMDEEEE